MPEGNLNNSSLSEAGQTEQSYLLNADGTVESVGADAIALFRFVDGEADHHAFTEEQLDALTIVVSFNSVADGRGFSQVKAIRQDHKYPGKILAGGFINPDQLSLAFQVGFDGVLVSEKSWQDYGGDAWKSALNPLVNLSYVATDSNALRSIWQQRHSS